MFRSVLCIKWNGILSDAPNKSLPDHQLNNKCDKIDNSLSIHSSFELFNVFLRVQNECRGDIGYRKYLQICIFGHLYMCQMSQDGNFSNIDTLILTL